MNNPSVIEFKLVNKWYGHYHALRDINLTVTEGERVIVCGPSGSGKSTLIRCINALEDFQSGTLKVNHISLNEDLRNVQMVRQSVGMVFQQFNLFPHLTVLENLSLAPIQVKKMSTEHAHFLAMAQLTRVHIEEHANKFPAQLSGGQQQRVAIARTLCMEPKILLFDEPTSALDPEMIQEVLDVMIELAAQGITMICVTHEMGFAKRVASRIVFMDQGQIMEQARPEIFFSQPQHPRAQSFLAKLLDH
ncbi:MAG: amino acid ABC transporter ATP-binding protein [Betaproteobacteria bacterium]|jgi:general L-amino acid transport system ATP-binding protein